MEEVKTDYKKILNDFYHNGKSKDWLKGYVQCLFDKKFVDFREGLELNALIHQCKGWGKV